MCSSSAERCFSLPWPQIARNSCLVGKQMLTAQRINGRNTWRTSGFGGFCHLSKRRLVGQNKSYIGLTDSTYLLEPAWEQQCKKTLKCILYKHRTHDAQDRWTKHTGHLVQGPSRRICWLKPILNKFSANVVNVLL